MPVKKWFFSLSSYIWWGFFHIQYRSELQLCSCYFILTSSNKLKFQSSILVLFFNSFVWFLAIVVGKFSEAVRWHCWRLKCPNNFATQKFQMLTRNYLHSLLKSKLVKGVFYTKLLQDTCIFCWKNLVLVVTYFDMIINPMAVSQVNNVMNRYTSVFSSSLHNPYFKTGEGLYSVTKNIT